MTGKVRQEEVLPRSPLGQFNRVIEDIQDDLFNQAFYLTGDQGIASMIVEQCVCDWYKGNEWRNRNFRLLALKTCFIKCNHQKTRQARFRPLVPSLDGLNEDEKVALILVDCLKYCYQEAAFIWSRPTVFLTKVLAAGRSHISGQKLSVEKDGFHI